MKLFFQLVMIIGLNTLLYSQTLKNCPDRFSEIDSLLKSAIEAKAFPGCVLLVAKHDSIVYHRAFGRMTYDQNSDSTTIKSIYDIASLTKVIATTNVAMRLVDEGKLHLLDTVASIIPEFRKNGKEHITIQNILLHNSGLPAYRALYKSCKDENEIIDSINNLKLIYRTGDSTVYSDFGFIILKKIIERKTQTSFDKYCDSVFFKPLGMNSTFFNPPKNLLSRIVPTEVDNYWQKTGEAVRGIVHDEHARVMGGVSGHAGLFSTAEDVFKVLEMLRNKGEVRGKRFLSESTIDLFLSRKDSASTHALGWDTKSPKKSWAGDSVSATAVIHTGFTGTSVVLDREKDIIVVFLTNRVYPSRSNMKISAVRPALHNAIYEIISKYSF